MPFILIKIVSGSHPAQEMSKSFDDRGGFIGRSEECDWILFDMTRIVSKQHASIIYAGGQFFLEDISTNGVFIAPSFSVLGRGNRKVLATNDSFRIGDFVFHVESMTLGTDQFRVASPEQSDSDLLSILNNSPANECDTANNIQPLHITSFDIAPATSSGPINQSARELNPVQSSVDQLDINRGQAPVVNALPDDWELSGFFNARKLSDLPVRTEPEIVLAQPLEDMNTLSEWDLPVAPQAPAALSPQFEKSKLSTVDESPILEAPPSIRTEPLVSAQQEKPSLHQAVSAQVTTETSLYLNLGLPPELSVRLSEGQLEQDVANIIQATTAGLMKLLQARAQFKHESRLAMTQVQPKSNNPLKFCIEPSDALELMLVKRKSGYLTPLSAYEEAIHDLQLHQTAFISGLQAAMSGILDELAPEKIEQEVKSSMLGKVEMVAHAQAWRLYKEKQNRLNQAVTHNFSEVMGKFFSDAYARFIAENSASTEKPDV